MNYCSHDPAACLVRKSPDGQLDYIHFEEGMLSRKKKSYQFPLRAIKACLDHFCIGIDDVDVVALDYMNAKTVHNTAAYYRKLLGDYVRAGLAIRPDQVYFVDSHHLAHAYTAFYPSGFDSAAVLVIDGLGSEQQTHSIFDASLDHGIRHIYSQRGTGIGKLYSTITEILGFEEGEEGKTMGLAPYGAAYSDIDATQPSLKGNYQGFCVDYSTVIRRHPTSALSLPIPKCPSKNEVYSPYYSRLAYNVQKELECAMMHLSREIAQRTGARHLCIAGGVGLNCVANEVIRESGIFEDVFVQSASADSGISLGLALAGIEEAAKRRGSEYVDWHASSGKSFWTYSPIRFDNSELRVMLEHHSVPVVEGEVAVIADAIANGSIVAYYEGGWEFGPRALGHRSFLADPRSPDMKSLLNSKIKHREGYRPFAPIVMKEYFNEYFESSSDRHAHMLFAVVCREKTRSLAPTIVHVDNTARVQTCGSEAGQIYRVLQEFHARTSLPMLVNTSLNDNNEPIVLTPIDALSCFLRTNADILVVNDVMVFRNQIPDVDALLHFAESHQRRDVQEKTVSALNHLMRRSDKLEDPTTFLARNLLGSLHAKFVASEERLVQELFVNPLPREFEHLVTDEFHHGLVREIAAAYKIPIPFSSVKIVDDNWHSVRLIPQNSYLLLYNLSVLQADVEVRAAYPALESCVSFYGPGDRRLSADRKYCDLNRVVDLVTNSYETDPSKTIDEFFAEIVHPAFRGMYSL
jgi:carbamoyltransferase